MSNIFQNNLEDLLEEFDPPADLLNMTTVKLEHTNSSALMIENSHSSLNNTDA
jgi:hypothetical protein